MVLAGRFILPERTAKTGGTRPARRPPFCKPTKRRQKAASPAGGMRVRGCGALNLCCPIQDRLRSVAPSRLRSRVVGRRLFSSFALRGQRLWWFKGFEIQAAPELQTFSQTAGTTTTACRWSARRRAAPKRTNGGSRVPPAATVFHAGGSPGSFGYFSAPSQKSNSSGGTRPAGSVFRRTDAMIAKSRQTPELRRCMRLPGFSPSRPIPAPPSAHRAVCRWQRPLRPLGPGRCRWRRWRAGSRRYAGRAPGRRR
jgi:hypothetical protein